MSRSYRPWSTAEVRRAIAHAEAGRSEIETAKLLGRSYRSMDGAAQRFGITFKSNRSTPYMRGTLKIADAAD